MIETIKNTPSQKREPRPSAPKPPALSEGCRINRRSFMIQKPEKKGSAKLHLNAAGHYDDLVPGDLISLKADGAVVPLTPELAFGGLVAGIAEGSQGHEVRLITRCVISAKIIDLNGGSKPGEPVYARPTKGATQPLSLSPEGAVHIGQLLHVEDCSAGRAIVGVKLSDDARPFESAGSRSRGSW